MIKHITVSCAHKFYIKKKTQFCNKIWEFLLWGYENQYVTYSNIILDMELAFGVTSFLDHVMTIYYKGTQKVIIIWIAWLFIQVRKLDGWPLGPTYKIIHGGSNFQLLRVRILISSLFKFENWNSFYDFCVSII